jgi:putative spermidine/putrescine transport system ATP-binding protein
MSKGKIEQIGTPTEIYNAPATHFVASFVGTLNLLNAEVQSPAEKQIVLDGESITVNDPIEKPVGTQLAVAIRPEAIRLNGHAKTAPNSLNGTLHDIYFLGSVVRLHVRLKEQFIHVDMFNDPAADLPERGEPITLGFMPDACRVLGQAAV